MNAITNIKVVDALPAQTVAYQRAKMKPLAEGVARAMHEHSGRTQPQPTTSDPRGDPKPLTVAIRSEPYPLDALPPRIAAAVAEVQGFTKAPASLVAATALAVISFVGQALADVRRMRGLEGPCSLYLLTIGESGERKTSCDKFFTKPIREWLNRKAEADRVPIAKAHAEADAWKARVDGLKESIKANTKQGKTMEAQEDQARLATELAEKPKPYLYPLMLRGEDTPEKQAAAMTNESPSLGVLSDEGGVILGGHGLNSDSLMRALSQGNIFWDGGQVARGRMSADSDIKATSGRMTMHLMVQESVFRVFSGGSNGLARGSGYMARFLVSWPDSTIGSRPITEAPSWNALEDFGRRIVALLEMIPAHVGPLQPPILELSPEAFALWRTYADNVERQSGAGRDLHDIKDIAAKSADNAARLAALFHVFDLGPQGAITAESMQAAIRVAAWHLNEARRFIGGVEIPAELVNASKLDGWLREYLRRPIADRKDAPDAKLSANEVLTKTVYQFGPPGMRDKSSVANAVSELEEQDRAWLTMRGRHKVIAMHPALLESRV